MAYRVPTGTVSVVDLTINAERATSAEEINAAFTKVAEDRESPLYGILAVETEPLVSSDFKSHPASSIVDALSTMVMEGTQVKSCRGTTTSGPTACAWVTCARAWRRWGCSTGVVAGGAAGGCRRGVPGGGLLPGWGSWPKLARRAAA